MNAVAERPILADQSNLRSIAKEQCVWVEVLDTSGRSTAAMQICKLPLALTPARCPLVGVAAPSSGVPAIHIDLAREGVLVATPADRSKVRFNGGPLTSLPHEFESWVLIDLVGTRFRVSSAGFGNQTQVEPAAATISGRFKTALASPIRLAKHAGQPMLLAALGMLAMAIMALADWLSTTSQATYWSVLVLQRNRAEDLAIWLAGWCAISHLLTGASRWLVHARLVVRAALAYAGAKLLAPPLFAAVGLVLPSLLQNVGWMILAAAAAGAHVAAMPAQQHVRRNLHVMWGLALVIGICPPIHAVWVDKVDGPELPTSLPVGMEQYRYAPANEALEDIAKTKSATDRARTDPFT